MKTTATPWVALVGTIVLALGSACHSHGLVGLLPDDSPLTNSGDSITSSECAPTDGTFCDRFNGPTPTGALDPALWEVSRGTGNFNLGQSTYGGWNPVDFDACGTAIQGAVPPDDVRVCNGRVITALNDGGGVASLTFRATAPFDIAGRTGTIAFDVSNDGDGLHAAWPEVWFTDEPLPAPLHWGSSWQSLPRNGFGLRFNLASPDETSVGCPTIAPGRRMGVGSAILVSNFVARDSFPEVTNPPDLTVLDCVPAPSDQSRLNHIEIRVSVDTIEVFAAAAGTIRPLKKIAVVNQVALGFTRGYVSFSHVHNDGGYSGGRQRQHAFAWDNITFDGPALPRAIKYVVPPPSPTALASYAPAGATTPPLKVPGVGAARTGSLLTFNFWVSDPVTAFTYTLNGHGHTFASPFPEQRPYQPQTIAIPVDASELVTGDNEVTLSSDATPAGILTTNVGLVVPDGP